MSAWRYPRSPCRRPQAGPRSIVTTPNIAASLSPPRATTARKPSSMRPPPPSGRTFPARAIGWSRRRASKKVAWSWSTGALCRKIWRQKTWRQKTWCQKTWCQKTWCQKTCPIPPGGPPATWTGRSQSPARCPDTPSWFTPRDEPAHNLWFLRAPAAIAAAKGLRDVAPFYVEQETPVPPGGYPQPGRLEVRLRNETLQYVETG